MWEHYKYWGKFLWATAEVCDPLGKLTSSKCEWTWNNTCQKCIREGQKHNKEKHNCGILQWKGTIIPRNKCIRCGSKSKYSASEARNAACNEWSTHQYSTVFKSTFKQRPKKCRNHYSNREREVPGILHGQEKFHCYCFACEFSMIIDHKPLVATFEKDVASLSHRL